MAARSVSPLAQLVSAGGLPLMAAALVARLPSAMAPMLLLVGIPAAGGSIATAGAAVGLCATGGAASVVLLGLVMDRYGVRWVVTGAAGAQCVALIATAMVLAGHAEPIALLTLAFALGATNPAVGSVSRAAWRRRCGERARRDELFRAAMGWEAAADEASFVIAPIVAAGAVTYLSPSIAMTATALLGLAAHLLFVGIADAASGHAQPDPADQEHPRRNVSRWVTLLALVMAVGAIGATFGTVQTSVTASMFDAGTPDLAGLIYAGLGVGSIVGGLCYARWAMRMAPLLVLVAGGVLIAAVAGLLAVASRPSPIVMAAGCAAIGLSVAPMLAVAYRQAVSVTPARRTVTVMTVLAASTGVGVGLGAAVAGALADGAVASSGFTGTVVAGLALLIAAGVLIATGRSGRQR